MPEELAVKWYEMSVLGLPSSALASFFGPLNVIGTGLRNRDSTDFVQMTTRYLPHILKCVKDHEEKEFFMNVYFEHEFNTNIGDLRKRLGIIKLE